MSSTNCFNLDQSKNLSSRNGLRTEENILENIVEKDEMLVGSIYSFYHNIFYAMKDKIYLFFFLGFFFNP